MSATEHVDCSNCGADIEITKEEAKLFGRSSFVCEGCAPVVGGAV